LEAEAANGKQFPPHIKNIKQILQSTYIYIATNATFNNQTSQQIIKEREEIRANGKTKTQTLQSPRLINRRQKAENATLPTGLSILDNTNNKCKSSIAKEEKAGRWPRTAAANMEREEEE
jgi:hypothetical protein